MGTWVDDRNAALLTDLYELTMAASYVEHGMAEEATFDLFVRELPPRRGFLVACGIEAALEYLETMRFDDEAVDWLRSLGRFSEPFLDRLRQLRFTGEVWAVPEGEVVFPGEPLLRVTAPLPEAQVVETFLLTTVAFETMVATKAARVALACGNRAFVDFSARRDHGPDAALKAARAAYVGGAGATSNVLAAKSYGIPLSGTMAHSYVMAFDREVDAFGAFARTFPEHSTLLIDTYDTVEGARRAVAVGRELAGEGIRLRGVRLDSGDLVGLSRQVRAVLDEGGQEHVAIFASGDLDEYRITELLAAGAPIDAFGVGTQLGTSGDAPSLSAVYKLAESGGPRRKLSSGKATLPGRKQVWRVTDADGVLDHDVIGLDGEEVPGATPLLRPVMVAGRPTGRPEPLEEARQRCRTVIAALPARVRDVCAPARDYRVVLSDGMEALIRRS
jgi:nicotinate phosphoribosyltransferase